MNSLQNLLNTLPSGVINKGKALKNENIPQFRYDIEMEFRKSGITDRTIINGVIDDLIKELKKPKSPSPMKKSPSPPKCPVSKKMGALKIKHGGVQKRRAPTKQELQRKKLMQNANRRLKQKELLSLMSGLKM